MPFPAEPHPQDDECADEHAQAEQVEGDLLDLRTGGQGPGAAGEPGQRRRAWPHAQECPQHVVAKADVGSAGDQVHHGKRSNRDHPKGRKREHTLPGEAPADPVDPGARHPTDEPTPRRFWFGKIT